MIIEIPFGLPGKIFRSPMPFSAFDKGNRIWSFYKEYKIDIVVVLIEENELKNQFGKDLFGIYRSEGLEILHFPIPDYGIPSNKSLLLSVIDRIIVYSKAGKNTAVHCLAGLGRSGLFLACIAKRHLDLGGQESLDWIRQFIPGAVENSEQEAFVRDF